MAEGNVSGKVVTGSGEGFEALLPSHMLNDMPIPTERRRDSNYRRNGSSHPPRSQYHQKNEKLNRNVVWGSEHGTRASFMDSCGSRRSCAGTGVFLPKIVITNVQPVNIKPGVNWEWKNNDGGNKFGKSNSHHEGGNETTNQGCNVRASSSPPDTTFLPKEWTY